MLSKCANPNCAASFRYLHDGKLFRMETPPLLAAASEHARKPPQRIEFFWLCQTCSEHMTLVYNAKLGVTTRLLSSFRASTGL